MNIISVESWFVLFSLHFVQIQSNDESQRAPSLLNSIYEKREWNPLKMKSRRRWMRKIESSILFRRFLKTNSLNDRKTMLLQFYRILLLFVFLLDFSSLFSFRSLASCFLGSSSPSDQEEDSSLKRCHEKNFSLPPKWEKDYVLLSCLEEVKTSTRHIQPVYSFSPLSPSAHH